MSLENRNIICQGGGQCLEESLDNPHTYTRRRNWTCDFDCQPQTCPNHLLCKQVGPSWYFHLHKGLCFGCRQAFDIALTFIDSPTTDCAVCMTTEHAQVYLPDCGHTLCVVCARDIIYWDETRYHLNPSEFGCPPCPNGCINPGRGKQCYCDEYDDVIEQWRIEYPEEFDEYAECEDESIQEWNYPPSVYGTNKCPLCRKQIKK